jgi:hypothetical protein
VSLRNRWQHVRAFVTRRKSLFLPRNRELNPAQRGLTVQPGAVIRGGNLITRRLDHGDSS